MPAILQGFSDSSLAPTPNQGDTAGSIEIAIAAAGGLWLGTVTFYQSRQFG